MLSPYIELGLSMATAIQRTFMLIALGAKPRWLHLNLAVPNEADTTMKLVNLTHPWSWLENALVVNQFLWGKLHKLVSKITTPIKTAGAMLFAFTRSHQKCFRATEFRRLLVTH